MENTINLNNNYYFIVKNNINKLPTNIVNVRKISILNLLKKKKVLLTIDFSDLKEKDYKKIIKKLLLVKNIFLKRKTEIETIKNSKILLGYIINYNANIHKQTEFISAINAIFYTNRYERYNYIYDTVCNYLDSYFYGKNLCDFKNNQCGEKRNTTSYVGCCHHYKNKLLGPIISNNFIPCEHLKEDYTCGAKCISCKLFTCEYLEKKGVKFKIKDILLLDTFFNPLQKYFIKYMVFTPKDKIIKRLMIL